MRPVDFSVVTGVILACVGVYADEGALASVNPFNGMQQREEVFEFTEKPAVTKEGGTWVITFVSKGNCDATVAIVGKDGKIIRHLASGVLGKNAPYPFQQGMLNQKIVWDGTDNMGKAVQTDVLEGCSVRVSLGLTAVFERNIGWDPYCISGWGKWGSKRETHTYMYGKGPDGELCVLGYMSPGTMHCRIYQDGKYVRMVWPPSADEMDNLTKLGFTVRETVWGDKVWMTERVAPGSGRYGVMQMLPHKSRKAESLEQSAGAVFELCGATDRKEGPWPKELPTHESDPWFERAFESKYVRLGADRTGTDLYFNAYKVGMRRIDGATGELDDTWFPKNEMDLVSDVCVGPDGLIYLSVGPSSKEFFIVRMTREGKPIDFTSDVAVPLPVKDRTIKGEQFGEMAGKKWRNRISPGAFRSYGGEIKSLWTGVFGHSSVHGLGMHVSARGYIVQACAHPSTMLLSKYGGWGGAKKVRNEALGYDWLVDSFVAVWDNDGNILTANAVGATGYSHGVHMDRDGNLYASYYSLRPKGETTLFGLKETDKIDKKPWGGLGSLVKFRSGDSYPLGGITADSSESVTPVTGRKGMHGIEGALWIYGSLTGHAHFGCTCHNVRNDMDFYGRPWVIAHHLHSVLALDGNGNVIARFGRYGNVDDTDRDVEAGRDGIRLVWPRAITVSDSALYVNDQNAHRILKVALSYTAEETVAIP